MMEPQELHLGDGRDLYPQKNARIRRFVNRSLLLHPLIFRFFLEALRVPSTLKESKAFPGVNSGMNKIFSSFWLTEDSLLLATKDNQVRKLGRLSALLSVFLSMSLFLFVISLSVCFGSLARL